MATPLSHQHDIQRVVITVCKLVEKALNIGRIQLGELQEKTFTRYGLDSPIYVEVLDTVLHGSDRFDAPECHTSALDRQQTNATFILAKDSYRTLGSG
jgi:hypothetical protein